MALRAISNSLSSAAARPVSSAEFANALFSVWRERGRRRHEKRGPNTFGLAISGGVDSMALAALFTDLQQALHKNLVSQLQPDLARRAAALLRDLKFKAFIVDHGVREGSASEAESVSSILQWRGIETQILKIDWGSHYKPGELPNFESLARKYRFQVLGKACRDNDIDSLFLAHHQDDQAETVLMRLVNGHRGFGLRGIKRSSEIPECHGIHGVHESGGQLERCLILPELRQRARPGGKPAFMEIEAGGVRVYRPLLDFGKNRLSATCEEAGIKWFEDHTNKDPTVTARNAIRHMYSTHAMPTALSAPSLVGLSETFKTKYQRLSKKADSYFKTAMKTFEPRTGVLLITFPDLKPLHVSLSPEDTKVTAAFLLMKAIEYVTPEEQINLSSLRGAVSRVFPETQDGGPSVVPPAFTIAGVYFQQSPRPILGGGAGEKYEWHLSRQLYLANDSKKYHIHIGPTTGHEWSPWTLFDGRFWIRIQNRSGAPVTIRPYQTDDREKFLSLGGKGSFFPSQSLKALAPRNVRWTLPVIIVKKTDGTEVISAFPSLNVHLRIPEISNSVNWQIRYKKVDMENLSGQRL